MLIDKVVVPVAIGIHGAASVRGGDCAVARPANAHVSNILCIAWFDTYLVPMSTQVLVPMHVHIKTRVCLLVLFVFIGLSCLHRPRL